MLYPICELRCINKHCKLIGITFQRVLQRNADGHDTPQIKLFALLEHHATATITIANRRSVPKASTECLVRGHFAEKVPVGPYARFMRYDGHSHVTQVFGHQTIFVVSPEAVIS